jgi:hypothetical protein
MIAATGIAANDFAAKRRGDRWLQRVNRWLQSMEA